MTLEIPYSKPWLTDMETRACAESVSDGRLILGPRVREFERALADFAQKPYAVATTSGTTALSLSLAALGVDHTWSVVVPSYTWVATWNVAHWAGAEVLLADVDPDTFCLDEADTRRAVRACSRQNILIIPVHMFGYRAGEGWLDALAEELGLTILGDGCCAFGGRTSDGLTCGAWSRIECLSFHPRKVITTGEGGAILVDDHDTAQLLTSLRDHGAIRSARQREQTRSGGLMTPEFPRPGFNFRMTEMQGAIGCAQMERVDEILEGRRRVAARYDELLGAHAPEWLMLPPGTSDPGRLLTCYVVQVRGEPGAHPTPGSQRFQQCHEARNQLTEAMVSRGIALRSPMIDLVGLDFTRASQRGERFDGAQTITNLGVGLPFFPEMTNAQVDVVVENLLEHGERSWRENS